MNKGNLLEKPVKKQEADCKDKTYQDRLERHMDELKWLYMELYDSQEYFDSLLENLKDFYGQRKPDLKKQDMAREQEPGWYRKNGMLGMMLYVDQFAGDLNGVREKLDYIRRCNVNYVHLMPLLDTVEGRSDGAKEAGDHGGSGEAGGRVPEGREQPVP